MVMVIAIIKSLSNNYVIDLTKVVKLTTGK